jgi:hypothetical protein
MQRRMVRTWSVQPWRLGALLLAPSQQPLNARKLTRPAESRICGTVAEVDEGYGKWQMESHEQQKESL